MALRACACRACASEYLYVVTPSQLRRNAPKTVTQAGSQQGIRGVRAANRRLMAAHLRVSAASLQIDAFHLQRARNSGVNDSVSAICSL